MSDYCLAFNNYAAINGSLYIVYIMKFPRNCYSSKFNSSLITTVTTNNSTMSVFCNHFSSLYPSVSILGICCAKNNRNGFFGTFRHRTVQKLGQKSRAVSPEPLPFIYTWIHLFVIKKSNQQILICQIIMTVHIHLRMLFNLFRLFPISPYFLCHFGNIAHRKLRNVSHLK